MWRLVRRGFEEGTRIEPHQAAIAALAGSEENDAWAFELRRCSRARQSILIGKVDRERAANDRLDPGSRHLVGEFERTKHIVGVGERERRLSVGLGKLA